MNIWYLSAYDQPYGQSPRTWDFSKELVRRGHKVSMFTNSFCHFTHRERLRDDERWRVEMLDGVRVVWLKTRSYVGNGIGRGLNMIDNVLRIFQSSKVLDDQPDVIFGPSVPLFTAWAAARLADRYKIPFIFEVRDVWPDALVDMGGMKSGGFTYRIFRYVERQMYHKATYISSTLPNLSGHVANSGSDPKKIRFIPNGVNLAPFARSEAYDGGENHKLVVMYVGGFGLDHDVSTIIRAAKILQDECDSRFRFKVIGGGVRKLECINQARSLDLKNIDFLDPVPKTSLPEVQSHADILVAAITDSKSYRFGLNLNKLCSYFASARPIVFSGNPPNNPVAESGAGVSVNAEDAIGMVNALRYLAQLGPKERVYIGDCGYQYAKQKLSIEELGAQMEQMIISAINSFKY